MARARNIKPGFFKNEDLAACSLAARLCFAGLWLLADREGRLEDRPLRIKGELFAYDSFDVEQLLDELEQHRFIYRYDAQGLPAIQIRAFNKHQTPHYSEKPSVIKAPPLQEYSGSSGGMNGGPLQDNSKKPPGIKRGSQPPDSLIPDSPNPDSLNPESPPTPPRGSAMGSRKDLSPKSGSREPAWRREERERIAEVAPAAVAGDVEAVFAPIGGAAKG